VKVTENGVTLDLLLRHIDPKKSPAPLEEGTIGDLLEAAHKYQLPAIMNWFEREAVTSKIVGNPIKAALSESFLLRNPTLVLLMAINYGIKSLIGPGIALRAGQGPLEEADRCLGFDAYHQLTLLRQKRVQTLIKATREICDSATVRVSKKGSHTSDTQLVCAECGYQRHQWIMDMVESVQKNPRWDILYATCNERSEKCPATFGACKSWVYNVSDLLESLKDRVMEVESEIPEI
jgi:hypothetical protein